MKTLRMAEIAHVAVVALLLMMTVSDAAPGLNITSYYSPKNAQRPVRDRTDYIILHTTEGSKKGSLSKVYRNGEANYFVDEQGRVYRIIDKRKVALHCGTSMWNGRRNIDLFSVGIEVVGYHNKDITSAQYRALRILLAELKRIFRVPDERVLTHSMVAYGEPNRWHRKPHRGRKRCGMLFAKTSVRSKIGLGKAPAYDPDVRAGRLVNADEYLANMLYGRGRDSTTMGKNIISHGRSAWDIAGDDHDKPGTIYVFPDGRQLRGNEVADWRKIPTGTKVVSAEPDMVERDGIVLVGSTGCSAKELIGKACDRDDTYYFLPDGVLKSGRELLPAEQNKIPPGTRILVGYQLGGRITNMKSAFDICGAAWNATTTQYMFPDGILRHGGEVNERTIPKNTLVFFK
ncbi:MAG: N-acetylmuramoyl-L-alanine amidase [Lentisphaerae bacterium]|nr:N-acetylmuramoyl-L-alanine amidase [Lentisphaerota bacterium]